MHYIPSACPHPTLYRFLGFKHGSYVTFMRKITSGPEKVETGVIRYALKLRPISDGRPITTGVGEARKLYPILIDGENINYEHKRIFGRIPHSNNVISIASINGGTGAAYISANGPEQTKIATSARTLILVVIETVQRSERDLRNIEFVAEHYRVSSLYSSDLVIFIQQNKDEILFVNQNLSPLIAALASETYMGDDLQNFSWNFSSKFVYVIDLGDLSSDPTDLADTIAERLNGVFESHPQILLKRQFLRTVNPWIEGKDIGVVALVPEGFQKLDIISKTVENVAMGKVVAKKSVVWKQGHCRVYLLVTFSEKEFSQTLLGEKLSEKAAHLFPSKVRAPEMVNVVVRREMISEEDHGKREAGADA